MSNYCMSNHSQGMRPSTPVKYTTPCNATPLCETCKKVDTSHIHWGDLPIAMGYIPMQKYNTIFDLKKGLQVGTIFPELWKPFCGKGGGC